jgi:hypothetical protein
MRLLAIISGEYGQRHVNNIRARGPASWELAVWRAPTVFPLIIDYPEEYLPQELPATDLILSFAEHRGVGELLPDIAQMTDARAVIAAVDNETWLPRGLARQLRGWLEEMNVACVTPKPLCSLTETHFSISRRQHIEYNHPFIREFATYFGRPEFQVRVDPQTRTILEVKVIRDAVCGCAHFVAERLVGISADDAEQQAGLLHHHYPCLASMGKDIDYGDTLMHISGNLLRDNIGQQVKPYKQIQYIAPGSRSDE